MTIASLQTPIEPRGDEPIFDALLRPHRSLGRRGFMVLMGFVAFLWLGVGAFFASLGAWPVFGFFGLDLLILYVGFQLNYRSGRIREEVKVWRDDISIRKIAASGRAAEHRFNPFWTKFHVKRAPEIGITSMAVSARDRSVPIGQFLNYDDRESFSRAFHEALATARRG